MPVPNDFDAAMHFILPEVSQALASGGAIVALESTLLAHGLPWPENLETAQQAEVAVRSAGAVPATIAVLAGRLHVGLTAEQLEQVAHTGRFVKASRRDLSAVVARKLDAATTVSATLWAARAAGIGVMATGGLGGVHREAATTFDVSNDLDELARAEGSLVVCSGVKSILDVPATLEALETRGVVVAGYRTGEFPGFTSVSSGVSVDCVVQSPEEAAALVRAHRSLGLPGAVVVAQPVPEPKALDRGEMERALAAALALARQQGIAGKAITPFLLEQVRQGTEGRSLRANRALIINNAALAAQVAMALSLRGGPT